MGAALLTNPDLLCSILTALRAAMPPEITVTAKIRLLPSQEDTLKLVERIINTGVSALTVHCRTRTMRDKDAALVDRLKEIVDFVAEMGKGIAVIENGDCLGAEDAKRIRELTGAHSVMIARAAEANPSCFSINPLVDLESTLCPAYLRVAKYLDNHWGSTKFCVSHTKGYDGLEEIVGSWLGEEDFAEIVKAIEARPPRLRDGASTIMEASENSISPSPTAVLTPSETSNPEPPSSGAPLMLALDRLDLPILTGNDPLTPSPTPHRVPVAPASSTKLRDGRSRCRVGGLSIASTPSKPVRTELVVPDESINSPAVPKHPERREKLLIDVVERPNDVVKVETETPRSSTSTRVTPIHHQTVHFLTPTTQDVPIIAISPPPTRFSIHSQSSSSTDNNTLWSESTTSTDTSSPPAADAAPVLRGRRSKLSKLVHTIFSDKRGNSKPRRRDSLPSLRSKDISSSPSDESIPPVPPIPAHLFSPTLSPIPVSPTPNPVLFNASFGSGRRQPHRYFEAGLVINEKIKGGWVGEAERREVGTFVSAESWQDEGDDGGRGKRKAQTVFSFCSMLRSVRDGDSHIGVGVGARRGDVFEPLAPRAWGDGTRATHAPAANPQEKAAPKSSSRANISFGFYCNLNISRHLSRIAARESARAIAKIWFVNVAKSNMTVEMRWGQEAIESCKGEKSSRGERSRASRNRLCDHGLNGLFEISLTLEWYNTEDRRINAETRSRERLSHMVKFAISEGNGAERATSKQYDGQCGANW
ncbi:hypothetical protein R3P38DRAFT_3505862 [Favolaschia claudopus]|uniref:DUS-like FMN-binding domain-containing protein n=1 Tax=Favolaschia claudopus TaxID=2862362 RepID=A0AAV9Z2E7_9AGAR